MPVFSQTLLSYIRFDTLEKYILKIFRYLLYATAIPEPQVKLIRNEGLQV